MPRLTTSLCAMLFLFLPLFAQGQEAFKCPGTEELQKILKSKLELSENLGENLTKFVEGSSKTSLPVTAMFTIDFNDQASVERRTKELQEKLNQEYISLDPYKSWLSCRSGNQYKSQITKIAEQDKRADQLRLNFFKVDPTKRTSLLAIQSETTKQAQALIELGTTQKQAEITKADAEKNQARAEAQSQEAGDFKTKELAAAYAVVEKYRQELADHSLKFAKDIEGRLNEYKNMTSELMELAVVRPPDLTKTYNSYLRSSVVWRMLTDATFRIWRATGFVEIPKPPSKIVKEEYAGKSAELQAEYEASLAKAIEEYQTAIQTNQDLNRQEKEILAGALLKAGAVRSQLYQSTRKMDPNKIEMLSNESIDDFINEIKVVPFRFVAYGITKMSEFKQKASAGVAGGIEIIKQVLVFVVVILVPILLFFFLQRLSSGLDVWRRQLISRSALDYRLRTSIALWLNRLNPYMPWTVMIIAAEISKSLLELAALQELGIFIPYLELYLVYRIFRKLLSHILVSVLVGGNLETLKLKNEEIQGTARRIGRLFFIEWALLHATEDAVRRVLVYTVISSSIWYFNFLFLILEFNKWRSEILLLSEKNLPKQLLQIINRIKGAKIFIVLIPILLFINLGYIAAFNLFDWLTRYDFFKQITSELYKKRLQDKAVITSGGKASKGAMPDEYLQYFDIRKSPDSDLYVTRSRESYLEVLGSIRDWITNSSEIDALVIYGDKGIGKTSLMKRVRAEIVGARAQYLDLPGKLTEAKDIFAVIGDLIGAKFESSQEFLELDEKMEKTVIFLDNAQNVFLANQTGLGAYRGLIDLMNLQTVNVFWCFTFNRRSWDYLKGVFGPEHFYGTEVNVRSWSDSEIQKMIEMRHRATGFHLRFDSIIEAVHQTESVDGLNQVEAQFFRLLWGQSRGNPRAAIMLWLSALKYMGSNQVIVSIPEFSRIDELANISDETLFVLAAIVRHENLSLNEIISVTNIEATKIKKAIKFCEDKRIIKLSTDDRLRVTPQAQYFVNSYLLGKNFLYE